MKVVPVYYRETVGKGENLSLEAKQGSDKLIFTQKIKKNAVLIITGYNQIEFLDRIEENVTPILNGKNIKVASILTPPNDFLKALKENECVSKIKIDFEPYFKRNNNDICFGAYTNITLPAENIVLPSINLVGSVIDFSEDSDRIKKKNQSSYALISEGLQSLNNKAASNVLEEIHEAPSNNDTPIIAGPIKPEKSQKINLTYEFFKNVVCDHGTISIGGLSNKGIRH